MSYIGEKANNSGVALGCNASAKNEGDYLEINGGKGNCWFKQTKKYVIILEFLKRKIKGLKWKMD